MNVEKRGFKMPISLEVYAAFESGAPKRKSHYEPVTPTEEQVAQHARARAALEELEGNPYIMQGREDDPYLLDLETRCLVFDETHEEYLERLRAWWEGRRS